MVKNNYVAENKFFKMIGLDLVFVKAQNNYNGMIFRNNFLVGYTKRKESGLDIMLYDDEYTSINIKNADDASVEGVISINKEQQNIEIKYSYLYKYNIHLLEEKNTKKSLKLSLNEIECEKDKNKVYYKLSDEKQFLSSENRLIKENIIYFRKIMPVLFDNLIENYDFPLKDYLQDIVDTPKQKRLLN